MGEVAEGSRWWCMGNASNASRCRLTFVCGLYKARGLGREKQGHKTADRRHGYTLPL